MFRHRYPVAWSYHRNTSRFPFNMHGLNPATYEEPPLKERFDSELVKLPPPRLPAIPLDRAVRDRASGRRFSDAPLSQEHLGSLLHAGYGVLGRVNLGGEFLERPVPSGGGLYPLELYVIVQNVTDLNGGAYHYVPLYHGLEVVHGDSLPRLLTAEMFLGQPYLSSCAALIVISAMVERSMWKYEDRGYRYILFEAGHVAQNLCLCTSALGLAGLNLGGFFDDDVSGLLRMDPAREIPLYGFAVGQRATQDRVKGRWPREGDGSFRQF